jgi:hypothetical protein
MYACQNEASSFHDLRQNNEHIIIYGFWGEFDTFCLQNNKYRLQGLCSMFWYLRISFVYITICHENQKGTIFLTTFLIIQNIKYRTIVL